MSRLIIGDQVDVYDRMQARGMRITVYLPATLVDFTPDGFCVVQYPNTIGRDVVPRWRVQRQTKE